MKRIGLCIVILTMLLLPSQVMGRTTYTLKFNGDKVNLEKGEIKEGFTFEVEDDYIPESVDLKKAAKDLLIEDKYSYVISQKWGLVYQHGVIQLHNIEYKPSEVVATIGLYVLGIGCFVVTCAELLDYLQ